MPQSHGMHLCLLGDFRLECDRQPVRLSTRKVESLLTYLVLHRSAPQSRQYLAFLLWPDSSEAQARTNLRQLLHSLRQALPEADQFMIADTQTLQWRSNSSFYLDVAEFEEALAQGDAAEQRGDPYTLRVALEQASALYQGDLLPSASITPAQRSWSVNWRLSRAPPRGKVDVQQEQAARLARKRSIT